MSASGQEECNGCPAAAVDTQGPMTQYQLMERVRDQVSQLYSSIDCFKNELIERAGDLIKQQIEKFETLIEEHENGGEREQEQLDSVAPCSK